MIDSQDAKRLLAILSADGEARCVGGCVRDVLMGKPYSDIDIATTHLPEKTLQLLQHEGIKTIPTGLKHGTITAVLNGKNYEITTLRKDVACDGRHAEVAFTDDWKEDAARRDFTMNAMSMDAEGKVYDYFGGKADCEKHLVRFVGSPVLRIEEDYLRILRMFRFHAYYGKGDILPEQLEACRACVQGLQQLSGERIQMEMLKLLSAPDPLNSFMAMQKTGVLSALLPQLDGEITLEGLEALLEVPMRSNALVRLAALLMLNEADEDLTEAIADAWKFSNDDRRYLLDIMFPETAVYSALDEAGVKRAVRRLGKIRFRDVALLAWAMEGHETTPVFQDMLKFAESWVIPNLPVRGVDILKMGVAEGREVGRLLDMAEDYWESNAYQTGRESLLRMIRGEIGLVG